MAKFEYEIGKALKETGLTSDRVRAAFLKGNAATIGAFTFAVRKHVCPNALEDVLRQFQPALDPVTDLSGNPRVDKALMACNIPFGEAKRLVALRFGYGDRDLTEQEKTACYGFTNELRKHMTGDGVRELVEAWNRGGVEKSASSEWVSGNCRFAQKKPRNDACPICGEVVKGGDKSIEPFFNHVCKPSTLRGMEGADKSSHDIGSQDIGTLSVAEDMAKSMMGYNKAWVLRNCKFAQFSEAERYDFAAGRKRARKMSEEALLWTINDIKETIRIQESAAREGAMRTPKLGFYNDELSTMVEELNRRRNPRPKRTPPAPQPQADIEAGTKGVAKLAQREDPDEFVRMAIDAEFNPDWQGEAGDAAYLAAGSPNSFEATVHYATTLFPESARAMESPGQEAGHEVKVTGVVMDGGRDILPQILFAMPNYFARFEERKAAELDAAGE